MKLATLLTQYLYNNQRLDLPGIGSFLLDKSAMDALENSKQRSAVLEGISFESKPSLTESPDLIAFISAQTGKMKALASADLDSHVQLALQFLNIGKPFTFEGIGTLVKVKQKEFEFIPISVSTDKVKELQQKEVARPREEGGTSYESFLTKPKVKQDWSRPLVALLIVAGLGLAIWGGYTISKRSGSTTNRTAAAAVDQTVLVTDATQAPAVDSTTAPAPIASSNIYKYVLEISPEKRAMKRYKQLRTNLWDVKLETNDSVQYKLYLMLPASSDTTRVLDSLMVMTGKRVYIEQQN